MRVPKLNVSRSKGVQLVGYLIEWYDREFKDADGVTTLTHHTFRDAELIPGTTHPVIYTFWRQYARNWGEVVMCGAWVGFHINGEVEFPDMSVPIRLEKLPRDAVRVPDQAALRFWLEPEGEHPMATALKAAIKAHNEVQK
jgi:hypothetical protein